MTAAPLDKNCIAKILFSDAADRCAVQFCALLVKESKHHQKFDGEQMAKKQSVTIDRWQRHSSLPFIASHRQYSPKLNCVTINYRGCGTVVARPLCMRKSGVRLPAAPIPLHSCPSGPRSSTQVRVCSHSWVQIPPNAFSFLILIYYLFQLVCALYQRELNCFV